MSTHSTPFTNPAAVASYPEETLAKVPGLADLHRMTALLLSERAPGPARILVVGAGGGLELDAMAQARPDWRFTGVDPSPAMLDIARRTCTAHADRVELVEGTVDGAPAGPFSGATCLLTLHFLDRAERLHTLREIRRRLTPGAALVTAHHAAPDGDAERWLARSIAFPRRSGAEPEQGLSSAKTMAARLPLLSPAEEEALLRQAGFAAPALFYAAFSFRGWVAFAD
ncbi:class I SAM-dependent methyltransferase [Stappia sp. 28M-7]|uniref:class I SAM-dependent methyltransferase n=1 Tax=Stappia sp. 28M-7 TaxID=2762596 RepID=UPI00163BE2F0|nr:class I SAM-dependent methyltransferase [Stappia sp. 28M-7]MBC2857997.1 class I SAM-dependent methyltransferase [Stappia sp. 28M-7]